MADSWWDALLEQMFGPQSMFGRNAGSIGQDPLAGVGYRMGTQFAAEVQRQEKAAAKSTPTPTPTPTPQASGGQPQVDPNARESELAAKTAFGAMAGTPGQQNPLYGNLPAGQVYVGKGAPRSPDGSPDTFDPNKMKPTDRTATIEEVLADLNTWSQKKLTKFAELAVDAGMLPEVTTNHDKLESVLAAVAARSAKMFQKGIKITPWALLERYGKAALGEGKSVGPITTTTVNRTIDLTSSRDANALVDAALQQRLGRSPTEKEKKEFLAALNAAEKKEPKVTKTTTTTTGSGTENVSSTSNTSSSGGVTPSSFAQEWALGHNKDEAGSYQALATYMPAFFAALGAPV